MIRLFTTVNSVNLSFVDTCALQDVPKSVPRCSTDFAYPKALPYTALREHCWNMGMRSAYFNSADFGCLAKVAKKKKQEREFSMRPWVRNLLRLVCCGARQTTKDEKITTHDKII